MRRMDRLVRWVMMAAMGASVCGLGGCLSAVGDALQDEDGQSTLSTWWESVSESTRDAWDKIF